jgi:hypothetical protein
LIVDDARVDCLGNGNKPSLAMQHDEGQIGVAKLGNERLWGRGHWPPKLKYESGNASVYELTTEGPQRLGLSRPTHAGSEQQLTARDEAGRVCGLCHVNPPNQVTQG